MRFIILIIALSTPFATARSFQSNEKETFQLTISHNNDMHSGFEQIDKYGRECEPSEAMAGKCFGGFTRVSSIIKSYRKNAVNGGKRVLYLNAGDTYEGSMWFTLFKDEVASDFMNLLKPDAMVSRNFYDSYRKFFFVKEVHFGMKQARKILF